MPILPITNPTCIVRNTGSARGRSLAIEPGRSAVKHLRDGRIILDGNDVPLLEVETGGLETRHPINFLWMMAAKRERDDCLFGVVNVHPDFAGGGSGIEQGRAR